MKKLILISFFGLAIGARAQSIEATAGSSQAQVQTNGDITVNGVVKANITQDGAIMSVGQKQTALGFIKSDGSIENANHTVVGYFMSNYDVQDANHNVIGHLRTNLDVKDANNVKIGTYNERIPAAWSAVTYFFFKTQSTKNNNK